MKKSMKIISFTCQTCGQMETRLTFPDDPPCQNPKNMCCKCCEKQGLQPEQCKRFHLEVDRFIKGVQLSEDDFKGLLLEEALSDALKALQIPHKHNPFNNTYPCYQNKCPDIVIEKLKTVIECKNLNKKQVDHLTIGWLDRNIIDRPHNRGYERKLVLFSYKPRLTLIRYLKNHGWKVYGLGTQILTARQERKAIGKLIRNFYWLKKEYYGDKLLKPKQQTRLKSSYLHVVH